MYRAYIGKNGKENGNHYSRIMTFVFQFMLTLQAAGNGWVNEMT